MTSLASDTPIHSAWRIAVPFVAIISRRYTASVEQAGCVYWLPNREDLLLSLKLYRKEQRGERSYVEDVLQSVRSGIQYSQIGKSLTTAM